MTLREELARFAGQKVVVDTRSDFVYLGSVESVGDNVLTLVDADVHNCSQSNTARDLYILQAKELGIRRNRRQTTVLLREVLSVSLLDEVVVL